jgi:hypothetical protein
MSILAYLECDMMSILAYLERDMTSILASPQVCYMYVCFVVPKTKAPDISFAMKRAQPSSLL